MDDRDTTCELCVAHGKVPGYKHRVSKGNFVFFFLEISKSLCSLFNNKKDDLSYKNLCHKLGTEIPLSLVSHVQAWRFQERMCYLEKEFFTFHPRLVCIICMCAQRIVPPLC